MQQIFYTSVSPEEYQRLGEDFPFPTPNSCPNPGAGGRAYRNAVLRVKALRGKNFQWWLYLYNRHGLEGLKPGYRSDRGKSRRVTEEIALKIQEKRAANPKLSNILLYEELVKDGVFTPDKLSPAIFYRFFNSKSSAGRPQKYDLGRKRNN